MKKTGFIIPIYRVFKSKKCVNFGCDPCMRWMGPTARTQTEKKERPITIKYLVLMCDRIQYGEK
jgi:hypothetical protein